MALVAIPWAPLSAQRSALPVAPDHWSFELLDALDAAGVANAWMSDFRPSSRAVVRGELSRVVRGRFGATKVAEAWLGRFDEVHPLGSDGGRDDAGQAAGGADEGAADEPRSFDWELRASAGSRTGKALFDPGDGFLGIGGTAARAGPVSAWLEAGDPATERLDGALRTTGIGAPFGPFQVLLGRFRMKAAGPATTSAQLAGEVPFDALYLASRRRSPLPWLEWLFGPVAWQLALAPWAGIDDLDRGWFGVGGLVAEPIPDFRIGAVRTARFGGSHVAPFTAERFFRTVFILANEPVGWDDQKIELTFRYRWSVFGQPMAAHVVVGQEDHPLWRDPSIVTGLTLPLVRDSGLWELRYEYAAMGARARWCPICEFDVFTPGGAFASSNWYTHKAHPPYERAGLPVGMPLGGYGASHTATVRFWDPGARYRVEGWMFFQVREEGNRLLDRWPGKRRGGGLEFLWLRSSPLELCLRGLVADGPEFPSEWGLEAVATWVVGSGS